MLTLHEDFMKNNVKVESLSSNKNSISKSITSQADIQWHNALDVNWYKN